MPTQDFILAPTTVRVRLTLEPTLNAFSSMILLNIYEIRSGLGEWVARTATALSPETLRDNKLFSIILGSFEDYTDCPTFPQFIENIAQTSGATLRDHFFNYVRKHSKTDNSAEALREDFGAFMALVETWCAEKPDEYDATQYAEIHRLLSEPEVLKERIVAHLHLMWERWLQPEWTHVLPLLEESLLAFRQLDFSDLTTLEAVRAVTGRDLSGYWDDADTVEEVIFVPSAHIGPYVTRFDRGKAMVIIFGARVPEGVRLVSSALNRSDLLVQLNALADDTRLSILELLTRHEEMCAQDIINVLALSQSSASRHLRQLTASGYLIERRRDIAKCYSLNVGRVQETALALRLFLARK